MAEVYYSDITGYNIKNDSLNLFSKERLSYVNRITDEKRKRQSVFAWLLLLSILKSKGISDIKFNISDNGKWELESKELEFSISHSENIVAVAVSNFAVGVDVERCSEKILKLKKRFISNGDGVNFSVALLTRLWTEKECKIKAKIGTNMSNITACDTADNRYVLSVLSNDDNNSFTKVNLSEIDV